MAGPVLGAGQGDRPDGRHPCPCSCLRGGILQEWEQEGEGRPT